MYRQCARSCTPRRGFSRPYPVTEDPISTRPGTCAVGRRPHRVRMPVSLRMEEAQIEAAGLHQKALPDVGMPSEIHHVARFSGAISVGSLDPARTRRTTWSRMSHDGLAPAGGGPQRVWGADEMARVHVVPAAPQCRSTSSKTPRTGVGPAARGATALPSRVWHSTPRSSGPARIDPAGQSGVV